LLKNDSAFKSDSSVWGQSEQDAFDELKLRLSQPPVLALCSREGSLVLRTDASNYALGAVLYQQSADGLFRPLEFRSKRMTPAQCNYAAHDRELLAVIYALREFRSYLIHREFVVETDNSALSQILKMRELSPKYERWLALIGDMQCTFRHRPGSSMTDADAFSRPPDGLPDCASPPVDLEQMYVWSVEGTHHGLTPSVVAGLVAIAEAVGYEPVRSDRWIHRTVCHAHWLCATLEEGKESELPPFSGAELFKASSSYETLSDTLGLSVLCSTW